MLGQRHELPRMIAIRLTVLLSIFDARNFTPGGLSRQLMDDCGVMSAMTATDSGKNKFDFLAETCFLQVGRERTVHRAVHMFWKTTSQNHPDACPLQYGAYDRTSRRRTCLASFWLLGGNVPARVCVCRSVIFSRLGYFLCTTVYTCVYCRCNVRNVRASKKLIVPIRSE